MNLFYRKQGSGTPLIILHGLFGQSDNWNTLARHFAETGLEVYTVDLRNHGLSPHDPVWNYEVMAADVQELIVGCGLSDVVLMGHSMGGMVAMQHAVTYQGVLSKLIVCDMAPKHYAPHHDGILEALKSVDFSLLKTRKEVAAQLSHYIKEEGVLQFLLKNLYWKTDTLLAWRFDLETIVANYAMVGIPFDTSQAHADVPAWFIRGERSDYILDSDESGIRKIFPNTTFVTIPNAGHWVHADQPRLFFEAVTQALKS